MPRILLLTPLTLCVGADEAELALDHLRLVAEEVAPHV
jgi:hypothetical protein